MLQAGLAVLQETAPSSRKVTYRRGSSQSTPNVTVTIATNAKLFKYSDAGGMVRIERSERDYVIQGTELPYGEPKRGDELIDTGDPDGLSRIYRILVPNGEQPWRWDPERTQVTVHTKVVGTE